MTNETITIKYFDWTPDNVVLPTKFSEDFKVTGDKKVAKENFQAIMMEFPRWVEKREEWLDRYKSIRDYLEGNIHRNYILELILNNDHPHDWKYNIDHEKVWLGCAYSFKLIRMIGDGFFTTGPWLFITGYTFCEPKKIFEVKIALELVDNNK